MTYWISGEPNDADFLSSLGIILGEYDEETGCFINCFVGSEALEALESCCMRYRYGIEETHIPAISKIQTIRETFEDAFEKGVERGVISGVDDFFDSPVE